METLSDPLPGKSLLLVEDDTATLECLEIILARKYPGVTLYAARDGETGLESFEAHRPDIVITDFNLPGMHGMQMASAIRAIRPETRFIFLSGDNGLPCREDAAEKGFTCDHFIVKPVDFKDLFGAIGQCLGGIENDRQGQAASGTDR